MINENFDTFFESYLETLLWSTSVTTEGGGDLVLGEYYDICDINRPNLIASYSLLY